MSSVLPSRYASPVSAGFVCDSTDSGPGSARNSSNGGGRLRPLQHLQSGVVRGCVAGDWRLQRMQDRLACLPTPARMVRACWPDHDLRLVDVLGGALTIDEGDLDAGGPHTSWLRSVEQAAGQLWSDEACDLALDRAEWARSRVSPTGPQVSHSRVRPALAGGWAWGASAGCGAHAPWPPLDSCGRCCGLCGDIAFCARMRWCCLGRARVAQTYHECCRGSGSRVGRSACVRPG